MRTTFGLSVYTSAFFVLLLVVLNLSWVACVNPMTSRANLKPFFPPPSYSTSPPTASPQQIKPFENPNPSNSSLLSKVTSLFLDSFTDSEAREKVLLAAAAYCHNLTVLFDWTCLPCNNLSDFRPISIMSNISFDTFGFVALRWNFLRPVIVVAFRGTCGNLPNVEVDADARTINPFKTFPSARVHWGFYRAYMSIRDQMVDGIRTALLTLPFFLRSNVRLELTGHSLGASMATIAAVDIKLSMEKMENIPIKLVTFGSPRVGNPAFASLVSRSVKSSYRVTHWRDPIVHIPIRGSMWGDYIHSSQEVFYNHDFSGFKICSPQGEDLTCSCQFDVPIDLYDHLHYFGMRVGTICDDGP